MRKTQTQRQIIDGAIQRLCQFSGNDNGGVRIVALTHVHDAGHAVGEGTMEEFFVVDEAVLGAAEGEDKCVIGELFGEFGKVAR